MKKITHSLLPLLLIVSNLLISNKYSDFKNLIFEKSVTLSQKKTQLYTICDKISVDEATKIIGLCDSLLLSNDKQINDLKEWIKFTKTYCLRKTRNINGTIELLKSLKPGNDEEFKFNIDNLLARCYLGLSDYNSALGYFQKNLFYFTSTKPNPKKQVQVISNIANCYRRMEVFEQALKFSLKAIEVAKQTKDSLNIYDSNSSLALYYLETKNYRKADSIYNLFNNFNKTLSASAKMSYYNNRSEAKLLLNDLTASEKYTNLCYDLTILEKDTFWTAIALVNKGNIASKRNDFKSAILFCKKAHEFATRKQSLIWQKNACDCVFENSYKNNNYKDAFDYHKLATQLKDSILSEKNKKEMTRKEFAYEYQLKSIADSVKQIEADKLKDAQIKAQESEIKQKRTQQFALIIGLILILIFAVFMYNRFKITQKQKNIIERQKEESEKQKEEIEVKQKEILDSIHYAKRIQMSLLPNETKISKSLNKISKK